MPEIDPAVVLLSGGQDSTTCLYTAIDNGSNPIYALTFYYNQRHAEKENIAARRISLMAGASHHIIMVPIFAQFQDSALVGKGNISDTHRVGNLPASFVPGRNIIFVTLAAAFAYKHKIQVIYIGVNQTDYSGYPDCRENTMKSLWDTIVHGFDYPFILMTPLINLSKKQIVQAASEYPGCWDALAFSHTCYEGKYPPCGECPACKIRAKGFDEAGRIDPLIERAKDDPSDSFDRAKWVKNNPYLENK